MFNYTETTLLTVCSSRAFLKCCTFQELGLLWRHCRWVEKNSEIQNMLQNYHLFALTISIFYTYTDMPKDIIITLLTPQSRNQDSSVSIVTWLWNKWPGNKNSISGSRSRYFSTVSRIALGPTQWVLWVLSQRGKAADTQSWPLTSIPFWG